jgi:carbamoyl-phosphate synthase small subunit
MMGIISTELTVAEAMNELKKIPKYTSTDFVREVSVTEPFAWPACSNAGQRLKLVIVDMGLRYNIARILERLGCAVTVVPCSYSASQIKEMQPDGVLLSPGPGDPALLGHIIENVKALIGDLPIMGICLGHQLIGRALGASTFKLKFGHRGGNHPVQDLATKRVYITTQNHGYAVALDTLKDGLEASHINLNDGTVEGLRHRELPLFTIQYHSEGSPGPQDNIYLFD